jgi:hypothetical protein
MKSVRKQIGGLGNLMFKEAYLIGKTLDGEIPDVYLQSQKYWEKHTDRIRATFSEGISPTIDKVALHIRRGDYKGNPFYVNLWETEYYKQATRMFPNDQFIVFCKDNQGWDTDKNDRQWCRIALLPLIGTRFELPPKELTEAEDMNLMASCKHIIMANSSFSWWAAMLNKNPNKIVVAPSVDKWYSDGVERTECPKEWIRL